MWLNLQFPAGLVSFTEEIFKGKLQFLYSVICDLIRVSSRVLADRGADIRQEYSYWLENSRSTICRKFNDGLISLNH